MKKRILLLMACGVLAAAMIAGCSSPQAKTEQTAPPAEETTDVYVAITHGYMFYLNDVLGFGLAENPTTGYTWSYALDGTSVVYASDEFYPDSTNENIVGAGGEHDFVFEGKSEGTTKITFTEAQQWEGGETAKTFTVTVMTDKDGNITSATEEV